MGGWVGVGGKGGGQSNVLCCADPVHLILTISPHRAPMAKVAPQASETED